MIKRQNIILLGCLAFLCACSPPADMRNKPAVTTPTLSGNTPVAAQVSQSPGAATQPALPSGTPWPTDEPFVVPTATNLVPTPIAQARYRLAHWTPQLANQLITTLREYPDHLGEYDLGYHNSGYYSASRYALFAEQEARLRFPASSFKGDWTWDAAYRMALIGDPAVVEAYAQLIERALDSAITNVSHLENWFNDHENRLHLKLQVLPALAKRPDNYLVEISDTNQSSGVFIWLVKERSSFSAYPLHASGFGGYGDFGFSSADGLEAEWQDVTGDGIAEIITTHAYFPGSGDALTTMFGVFDISQTIPRKIEFIPPISRGRERTWQVVRGPDGTPHFQFEFVFDRMLCPFKVSKDYQWNGKAFELINQTYPDKAQLIEQVKTKCLDEVVFSLLYDVHAGDIKAINEFDNLIDGAPYSDTPWWSGDDNSPAARDMARFSMGIYLALNGQVGAARTQMSSIVSKPAVSSSRWITPAREFLSKFHVYTDLPKACAAVRICSEFLDIDELTTLAKISEVQDIVDFLRQMGVKPDTNGFIDANNDGRMDRWITVKHGDNNPTVWLVITTDTGWQAFGLGNWSPNKPIAFRTELAFQGFPVFSMETDLGTQVYIFYQDTSTDEIQLSSLCDQFRDTLNELENNLLAGKHSKKNIEELASIGPRLDFACSYPYSSVRYVTPHWQYLLGLAYELDGNARLAAENYFSLWQTYPDSVYAIMAHSKLELAP